MLSMHAICTSPREDSCVQQAPFDSLGAVYTALEQHQALREQEDFLESGHVRLQLQVPADSADDLRSTLADSTSGQAELRPVDPP